MTWHTLPLPSGALYTPATRFACLPPAATHHLWTLLFIPTTLQLNAIRFPPPAMTRFPTCLTPCDYPPAFCLNHYPSALPFQTTFNASLPTLRYHRTWRTLPYEPLPVLPLPALRAPYLTIGVHLPQPPHPRTYAFSATCHSHARFFPPLLHLPLAAPAERILFCLAVSLGPVILPSHHPYVLLYCTLYHPCP